MAMATLSSRAMLPPLPRRAHPSHRRHAVTYRHLRTPQTSLRRYINFAPECYLPDFGIELDGVFKDDPSPGRNISYIGLTPSVLDSKSLEDDEYGNSIFTELPVLSEEEQDTLAAVAVHPGGLYALYTSYLAANLVERVWSFAWPAAVAMLHPSLLSVAVVGFFTKIG